MPIHSGKCAQSCGAVIGSRMCPECSVISDWLAGHSATEHDLPLIGFLLSKV